jgi:hypothetical protein
MTYNPEDRNKWLHSLSDEDRQAYYNKRNAKNRERYSKSQENRDFIMKGCATRLRNSRALAINHLGGRCVSSECQWSNSDGSTGCTEFLCLQIDHVNGDGARKRKAKEEKRGLAFYRQILKEVPGENYQLLCANCNWIKRHTNNEIRKSRFFTEDVWEIPVDLRTIRKQDKQGRFTKTSWKEEFVNG